MSVMSIVGEYMMHSVQVSFNDEQYQVFKQKGEQLLQEKKIDKNSDYAIAKHLIIRGLMLSK